MINQRKQTSDMFTAAPSTGGNRDSEYNLGGGFEYCKAAPDSTEWQAYQVQRVLSIKELKKRNLKIEGQSLAEARTTNSDRSVIEHLDPNRCSSNKRLPLPPETSGIPAILKKVRKYTAHSQPKDISNVTWKEPVADMKFLPVGWMKVPVVPKFHHQQAQARPHEKNLTGNKISSVENNVKGKFGIARKQVSINFTERSGKNRKPHKRNNGKSNLNKPIANVESEDNSKVNTIGRRRNNAEQPKKMNSENSSKKFGKMPTAGTVKSQKETLLPTDASAPTGKSFSMQTFENDSFSSEATALEMEVVGEVPAAFGIKHDQAISDNNNNNNPLPESTTVIVSCEINQGKASAAYNIQESDSNSNVYDNKCLTDTKTNGVDDTLLVYSTYRQDSNGNTIVSEPTQTHAKKMLAENSTMSTAKSCFGMPSKEQETVFGRSNSTSFRFGEPHQINEVDGGNGSKKFHDFRKELITKEQEHLIRLTARENSGGDGKNGFLKTAKANIPWESNFGWSANERKNKLVKFGHVESILKRLKPPELPDLEVCNVVPGTPEWQKYWDDFNQKIGEYYSCVERYSKQMDALLVEDDENVYEYKNELRRRHQDEMALKIRMGMTLSKPPLIRQPLKDTLEIGGYVIRPLGGAVDHASVSTCDQSSFRLEIPCDKMDSGLDGITVDKKLNAMTIAIPSGEKSPFLKLVQISVPIYKKVQNLEIGSPLYNGGKLVVIGK